MVEGGEQDCRIDVVAVHYRTLTGPQVRSYVLRSGHLPLRWPHSSRMGLGILYGTYQTWRHSKIWRKWVSNRKPRTEPKRLVVSHRQTLQQIQCSCLACCSLLIRSIDGLLITNHKNNSDAGMHFRTSFSQMWNHISIYYHKLSNFLT
jgi:hypothetical protein